MGSIAMDFWKLEHPPDGLAAIVTLSGQQKTYGDLRGDMDRAAAAMPQRKSLLMLLAQNGYESLVIYLAALQSGHALMLTDAAVNPDFLTQLVNTYRPESIYSPSNEVSLPGYSRLEPGLIVRETGNEQGFELHQSLALLLSTSGSTGSPKLVRLSRQNLQANAASIASYLNLTEQDRPITSLPMSYSYGLSVVNSHLLAGACLTLTDYGILRREFWDILERWHCTSLAGVPYTYQMLLQTGLMAKRGASLRTITQAGGALGEEHIRQVHQFAVERGIKFFVMYGQTEATARISYVPFDSLSRKIGSIGVAIPGGSLEVDSATDELVYTGPNVMLGYAECRGDLAKGDELGGVLRTGDLARQDSDGFFYITGRLKRFLKLFGKRLNLDEIEQIVLRRFGFPTACFGRDDHLRVAIETGTPDAHRVKRMLCESLSLPTGAVEVECLQQLPRTARGKMDYKALEAKQTREPTIAAGQVSR